jgi:hypothetical protein
MPVIAVTRRQLHHATGHDRRFGLERLAVPVPPRLSQKVHDFFDNFWLVGLVWTFNP